MVSHIRKGIYESISFCASVVAGKLIVIDPKEPIKQAELECIAFQSLMAVIIQQRGGLPLKASAVELNGKAVLFLGNANQGKTTISEKLIDKGAKHLSCGIVVIKKEQGKFYAYPGIGRVNLTPKQYTVKKQELSHIYSRHYLRWIRNPGLEAWEKILTSSIFMFVLKDKPQAKTISKLIENLEESNKINKVLLPPSFDDYASEGAFEFIDASLFIT